MIDAEFLEMALAHPANQRLLERLRSLHLPQCYLTAGCLYQVIWNRLSGRSCTFGIKDYDVFYFDGGDLSEQAEDAVIRQVHAAAGDLGLEIEVKNQARVHLWYPQHFGQDYAPLSGAREGIDRFLVSCTCVGIEAESGQLYAPYGLSELAAGLLRMNPLTPFTALFYAKAASYQARWPWLRIQHPALPP